MNALAQLVAVTSFCVSTTWQRRGAAAAAIFGIAGVVAVFVAVLSIAEGFREALTTGLPDDSAIVLRSGADTEMMSGLAREDTRIVADAPGVARSDAGALSSAELFVVINLPKRTTGTDANVPLRGVEPAAFEVRDEVRVVQGRPFQWGRNEVLVGRGAAREFAGLDLGADVQVGTTSWTVVGIFEADGGLAESEMWTDAAVLQPAYRRGDTFQSVRVRLTSAAAFERFKAALTGDPRLNVKVERLRDFYAEQSEVVHQLITRLGTLVAVLMSAGAIFGAFNTLYTSVAARTREIATLRALGFGSGPVVLGVLAEATSLALVGGILGTLVARVAFDGFQTATMNWQTFSQVTFAFRVTPWLLVSGLVAAVAIGLVGGIVPAVASVWRPIAQGLRDA